MSLPSEYESKDLFQNHNIQEHREDIMINDSNYNDSPNNFGSSPFKSNEK